MPPRSRVANNSRNTQRVARTSLKALLLKYYRLPLKLCVYLGLLVVAANVARSFWESIFIQKEIADVKSNLLNLKETVSKVGIAYDQLYKELEELAALTEPNKTNSMTVIQTATDRIVSSIVETTPGADVQKVVKNESQFKVVKEPNMPFIQEPVIVNRCHECSCKKSQSRYSQPSWLF
ncbi:uncharacterized protein LOC105398478 [Plutella xylostella]|uniref:uncharacterized protein LOC105398478 n=1 Tax=Plutella xylostella TaxID=51655 RepID=UPI00203273B2|nr:uncharacterized protein LOC105398478 [Plutella xylostella]